MSGWALVPEILMGTWVPAPSLAKKGSTGLRSRDFQPVTIWETWASRRAVPLKSRVWPWRV